MARLIDDPRLVEIDDQLTALFGRKIEPRPPIWPAKDRTQTTIRRLGLGALLRGRVITAVEAAASCDLTVVSAVAHGPIITLVLQGGQDGTTARVEIRALCADGTDEVAAALLPIIAQITLPRGDFMPWTQSLVTVGTVPGVFQSIPIVGQPRSSVSVLGTVTARNVDTDDTISWDIRALIKGIGTPAAQVAQQSVRPYQADAGIAGVSLTVTVTGPSIAFVAVGLAGATINWGANFSWTAV